MGRFNILILALIIFLSGCSPFPGQVIEDVTKNIGNLFSGKASAEIVSGGTQVVDTNPSVPSQNYKVTTSMGGVGQTVFQTGGGYKVYTSIPATQ